ncbi:MAG: right-handed parallel beta-helix repeat-containing protein [Myxococcota bacterium]
MPRLPFGLLILSITTLSCGEQNRPDDGEPMDGPRNDSVAPPSEPTDPALPQLTPCAEGFIERDLGDPLAAGARVCEPWTSPPSCPAGEAPLPRHGGCAAVSSPCPAANGFPQDVPADAVFVRAGATGTGTETSPLGTIQAGLDRAPSNGTVVIAAGTYREALTLRRPVNLRGACASATEIAPTTPTGSGIVSLQASEASLSDLSISGPGLGIAALSGGDLTLSNVVVEDVALGGVVLVGGTLAADHLVIRRTRPANDGTFGTGLNLEAGAQATVTDSVFEANPQAGVAVFDAGTQAEFAFTSFLANLPRVAGGTGGEGIKSVDGADVTVRASAFEANHGTTVLAENAALTVEDSVLRDTQDSPMMESLGRGATAIDQGMLTLRRCHLERHRDIGVFATLGSIVDLEDVVVSDTAPQTTDGEGGFGLLTQNQAGVQGNRILIRNFRTAGASVVDPGSRLELNDLTVLRGSPRQSDSRGGVGVQIETGATAVLQRAHIEDVADYGLGAVNGASGRIVDLRIQSVSANGLSRRGEGLLVFGDNTSVTVERAEIRAAVEGGVLVSRGTLAIQDARIEDQRGQPEGIHGRGITVQNGAELTGSRLVVANNRETGLVLSGDTTRVTLDNVLIDATLRRACADDICQELPAGFGLLVSGAAQLSLDQFVVRDNETAGAVIRPSGTLMLLQGEIRGHQTAVSYPGTDFAEVFQDVAFVANDRNLETMLLPIPEAVLDDAL